MVFMSLITINIENDLIIINNKNTFNNDNNDKCKKIRVNLIIKKYLWVF